MSNQEAAPVELSLEERVTQIEDMQEFIVENTIECLAKLNALMELLVIAGKLTQKQMEEVEALAEANKEMLAQELIELADEEALEAGEQ